MREADFHRYLASRAAGSAGQVVVGPGDDCGVLDIPGDHLQLITTDQLIAGRHYDPATAPAHQIARKALARSISDIAAMAGTPVASVCTACFAPGDADLASAIHEAMARVAEQWGAPLVGGDFALGSQTILTTTVLGTAPRTPPGPLLRSGARPGDRVWVTGAIGGSFQTDHHLNFEPRHRAGQELRKLLSTHLHAAIDISDGLGRDCGRIARASGIGILLDMTSIPLRVQDRDVVLAIADGEDYELLFTADATANLPERLSDGTPLTCIGEVVEAHEPFARMRSSTSEIPIDDLGWDHAS